MSLFTRAAEIAYRFDLPFPEWLDRLAYLIRNEWDEKFGLVCSEFNANEPAGSLRVGKVREIGDIGPFHRGLRRLGESLTAADLRPVLHTGCHTMSELTRLRQDELPRGNPLLRIPDDERMLDLWAVTAVDSGLRGLFFAVPLQRPYQPSAKELIRWRGVAHQIAAGLRLRRRVRERVEARRQRVPVASGHAGPEHAPHVIEDLTQGVSLLHSLQDRSAGRAAAPEPQLWEGLVGGGWSLVEEVESAGRRYLILVENPRRLRHPRALGRRERQVVELGAQGEPNKVIAFELGISTSAVSTHLQRALRKLNIRNRTELIWLYGAIRGGLP